jgi:hypothetical protein
VNPATDTALAWIVAIGMLVVPLVAGRLAGRLAGIALRGMPPWLALAATALVLVALLPMPAALLLAPLTGPLGFYDWWLVLTLLGVGALPGVHAAVVPGRRASRAAFWAGLAATALLLEAGARLLLPSPIPFPRPTLDGLRDSAMTSPCRDVFEGDRPAGEALAARLAAGVRDRPARVLHLGDSMIAPSIGAVEPAETWPGILDAADPSAAHLNAGIPGSSIDGQFLVLTAIVRAVHPSPVLLFVQPLNDLELTLGRPCCGGRPFIDFAASGPRGECREAQWRLTARDRVLATRLAFPLKALGHVSDAARHLAFSLPRVAASLPGLEAGPSAPGDASDALEAYARGLAAMKGLAAAEGFRLAPVLLPERPLLVPGDGTPAARERHDAFSRVLRASGLPWLDALAAFAPEPGEDPVSLFAAPDPSENHFGRKGHARMARWLRETLDSMAR